MAAEDTVVYTDDNFKELTGSGVALVDLYADWCGPCKIMAPTIDKLAAAYKDKAKVGKLNVDDHSATAGSLSVSSIPTIVIFKDGQEVSRFVGVKSESDLSKAIDEAL